MTPEKILELMREKKWEEAKWVSEALLRSKGVSKAEVLHGSTKMQLPLSAADLPTQLGMLLEIQTPTGPLVDDTSRSSIKKAITYLQKNSGTNSETGPTEAQPAPSSTPSRKRLHSNRKFWPGEAKDVFWSLVKRLNKYDKEATTEGDRSPLQLWVAEEATRQWWRGRFNVQPDKADEARVDQAARTLGCEVAWIRPG